MNDAPAIPDISSAFAGAIKRPKVSSFYTLGLFLVTLVMAILPLIYLGLIALVAYGTYYHAVHHTGLITATHVGGRGLILTFFMFKPLLAHRIHPHQPYALNPENEPTLYEFIRQICAQVGAPMPALIELDSDVYAAAGLRDGFKSFFTNELSLHIGLSLMAGLTMREFAGVIAHEFGHFTQGAAMRLSYIIARLGVWFSRQVLFVLMLLGHAISCFLSRQMEFHADQFAIRLAGSQAFETMVHLQTRALVLR